MSHHTANFTANTGATQGTASTAPAEAWRSMPPVSLEIRARLDRYEANKTRSGLL